MNQRECAIAKRHGTARWQENDVMVGRALSCGQPVRVSHVTEHIEIAFPYRNDMLLGKRRRQHFATPARAAPGVEDDVAGLQLLPGQVQQGIKGAGRFIERLEGGVAVGNAAHMAAVHEG